MTISTISAVVEARKALAETKARVIVAQWKTLIESLREAGTLDNCIAVCDVSASMGCIYGMYDKNHVEPIFASVSLSLVLASLAKPPFDAGFITFSALPQYVRVDLSKNKLLLCPTLIGVKTRTSGLFSLTCSSPSQ